MVFWSSAVFIWFGF